MKSFVEAYLDGEATVHDIDEWMLRWEKGVKDHTRMSFLGFDWPEPYKMWCENPAENTSKVLKMIEKNYEGMSLKELDTLAETAKFSGWPRDKGAKLILRLIAEIRRLRTKLGMTTLKVEEAPLTEEEKDAWVE